MTDPDLVRKKLAALATYVRELRELADLSHLESDPKEERFVLHTLQIAIQSVQDIAGHIVSDDRLGEPRTNRDLLRILARNGWIDEDLAESLQRAIGFRNLVVHGYGDIELEQVRHFAEQSTDDLLRFAQVIRARLDDIAKD